MAMLTPSISPRAGLALPRHAFVSCRHGVTSLPTAPGRSSRRPQAPSVSDQPPCARLVRFIAASISRLISRASGRDKAQHVSGPYGAGIADIPNRFCLSDVPPCSQCNISFVSVEGAQLGLVPTQRKMLKIKPEVTARGKGHEPLHGVQSTSPF